MFACLSEATVHTRSLHAWASSLPPWLFDWGRDAWSRRPPRRIRLRQVRYVGKQDFFFFVFFFSAASPACSGGWQYWWNTRQAGPPGAAFGISLCSAHGCSLLIEDVMSQKRDSLRVSGFGCATFKDSPVLPPPPSSPPPSRR